MPKYDIPATPLRFVTLAVSTRVPGGVIIGSSDIVEYAQIIGHAGLSQFKLPQDENTRILVWDSVTAHAVHSGSLDSEGQPIWDGRPLIRS